MWFPQDLPQILDPPVQRPWAGKADATLRLQKQKPRGTEGSPQTRRMGQRQSTAPGLRSCLVSVRGTELVRQPWGGSVKGLCGPGWDPTVPGSLPARAGLRVGRAGPRPLSHLQPEDSGHVPTFTHSSPDSEFADLCPVEFSVCCMTCCDLGTFCTGSSGSVLTGELRVSCAWAQLSGDDERSPSLPRSRQPSVPLRPEHGWREFPGSHHALGLLRSTHLQSVSLCLRSLGADSSDPMDGGKETHPHSPLQPVRSNVAASPGKDLLLWHRILGIQRIRERKAGVWPAGRRKPGRWRPPGRGEAGERQEEGCGTRWAEGNRRETLGNSSATA